MILDSGIVNEKIFANNVGEKNITVSSYATLYSALESMPSMLTENVFIDYNGAEIEQDSLNIENFYGTGSISISGLKLNGSIHILNCNCPITLTNATIRYPGATPVTNDDPDTGSCILEVKDSEKVVCENCSFTSNTNAIGVSATCSKVLLNSCKLKNLLITVLSRQGGFIVANCAQAADASDNTTGAWVYYGGIVILCATTSILLGGEKHKKQGGAIIRPNGTLA